MEVAVSEREGSRGELRVTGQQYWTFRGGIHPPQHKHESTTRPVQTALLPRRLILPLQQHIGEPAKPVVEVGEHVLRGQVVARASDFVSAPVHASSSGTVTDIGDYPIPHPSGLSAPAVVIETDGLDQWIERHPIADYTELNASALRNTIREAGIVGLGGAGFPTFIKLNPGPDRIIDTLILNGVECEPYITCDDMLLRERPEEIIAGSFIMRHALQARHCVIAIEDNKPEAYEIIRPLAEAHGIEVAMVPTKYPQGSEKQLIQVITGKEVPSNGLPVHVGIVVHNVATAVAVYRAIEHGEPLTSRYVTVTGSGISPAREPGRTPRHAHAGSHQPMRRHPGIGATPHHGRTHDGICPAQHRGAGDQDHQLRDRRRPGRHRAGPPAGDAVHTLRCMRRCVPGQSPAPAALLVRPRQGHG